MTNDANDAMWGGEGRNRPDPAASFPGPDLPAAPSAPAYPQGGAPAAPARPRRRPLRWVLVGLLLVAGLAGVGGGGGALAFEFTRPATNAEVAAAVQAEVASRWQRIPAGQIFPSEVHYVTADGASAVALRVGIAPAAPCAAALDPSVASLLRGAGCRTVLRATYVDATGALAATLGIAVVSSTAASNRIESGAGPAQGWDKVGVRAAAFPGTVARRFTDAARQEFAAQFHGPYVFLVASGHADGRDGARAGATGALSDLNVNLPGPSMTALTSTARPCARKDITC